MRRGGGRACFRRVAGRGRVGSYQIQRSVARRTQTVAVAVMTMAAGAHTATGPHSNTKKFILLRHFTMSSPLPSSPRRPPSPPPRDACPTSPFCDRYGETSSSQNDVNSRGGSDGVAMTARPEMDLFLQRLSRDQGALLVCLHEFKY